MAGETDWGTTSEYVGPGKPPKSDWKYSNAPLLAHLTGLRTSAGITDRPPTPPTPEQAAQTNEQALQADRNAWKALRNRRAIRA